MAKLTKKQELQKTSEYVAFLERAVASKNFQANDPERYEEAKEKLKKARFRLKLLK
jgi:hypothetical protein